MFTGIIQQLGVFRGYGRGKRELIVEVAAGFPTLPLGESVAVDGACLSLVRAEGSRLAFDISRETAEKTILGSLRTGAKLNLETSLTLQSLLSGHLLLGHVDGRGRVLRLLERRPGRRLTISFPPELRPYIVPKGSIGVNGVSLTVAQLGSKSFDMELVPITIGKSNLVDLKRGQEVNLECDILGKYVYNWVSQGRSRG